MRQASPQTEIDSAAADAVFGQIDTVMTPAESEKQNVLSERHDIRTQAESMMKRTVMAIKKLLGLDEQNRRMRSPRRSLGGVQNLEARMLMSGTPAEIRMIDANGAYVLQQETLTETKKIDFSTLTQGVKPEMWTTTIEGLGQVTMWFQGGTRVDNQGISAVQQPLGGTGFWFKFDNASVKLLSVELEKEAPTQGFLRIVKDNDYIRENGVIKNYNFAPTINFQGDLVDRIDGGQNGGRVSLRSITVSVAKTQSVRDYIEPEVTDMNANGIADELAFAQQEGLEEVLAPVGVTMEVIGNQGVRGLRITAPFDETYLDTGRWGVIKTVHQGGANDLRVFNNYLTDMMDNAYGSQTKTMTLYADKEMQVPISEITFVGNRGGFSHFSAIAQSVRKNMLPEGIETEPVPKMHIAHLSGPNVLFQVSSPIAQSTIEFAGVDADSILGIATMMKSAEGVMSSASITMNPANPSGDYNVFMKGPDGRVFERVLLRWNRDTKQLTLGAGEAMWTAPESLQPSVDAAVVGMTQSLTDMTTNDPSLKAIQQEILLTAASSMPGMGQDFDTAFWAAHPEWKDDAINAKALADSQTSNFSYSQIRQGLINQKNDTLGILRENYGRYQGMLGDLMKQASEILCKIRNGENESELRRLFAITVDSYATSLPMVPLASIGIRMPTSTQILFAAKCACDRVGTQLVALKEVERLMILAEQERSNNPNYAGSGSVAPTSTELEAERRKQQIRAAQSGLTMYAQDGQTEIGRGGVLFTDAGNGQVASTTNVDAARYGAIHETLKSSSQNYQYGVVMPEGREPTLEKVELAPRGHAVIRFTLKERMMVNLSSSAVGLGDIAGSIIGKPNIDFHLYGKENNISIGSNHAGVAGESISRMLEAGTYYLTIIDATSYGNATERELQNMRLPEVPVHVEFKPFHTANIEGKISIDGSEKVMPVSMRVAEFDDVTGKRKEAKDASELKTDKPVWVVIHGMDSSERTDIMVELVKALKNHPDMQVVTVNWEDAAADGIPTQDAKWTPAVGKWIARQLLSLGFSPQDIELKGWSHGSYVAQALAEEVFNITEGQKVGSLVALDPAGNWELLSRFNHKIIDFKKYADYSLAIEGSWIAGSDELARTADTYIKLNSLNTGATQIRDNHTTPVTFMASLLDYNRVVGGKQKDFISIEKIMNPALRPEIKGCSEDRYSGGADFVVDVNVEERLVLKDGTYYTYPYAFPFKMHYFDTNGIEKEIDFDGTPE